MRHYLLSSIELSEQMTGVREALLADGFPASMELISVHTAEAIDVSEPFGLLVMAELDWLGSDSAIADALRVLMSRCGDCWKKGGLIVYSEHYWFTKRYAQQLLFVLNQRGVSFPGQSVFEVLPDFINLKTWQVNLQLPMSEVWRQRLQAFTESWLLGERLSFARSAEQPKPRLLVLHGSHHPVSNTLRLWELVEEQVQGWEIQRMPVQNGTITDCKGCAFTTCVHYAQNRSCYYGGQMTMEILPAIEAADAVVWVSPNYNDALSAMHAALINRLTVLYRRISFKQKAMYGVVVSGNSGCDSVACQLIGALNVNKGFFLPPRAILTAIANAPGSLERLPGIHERARAFALGISGNHLDTQ